MSESYHDVVIIGGGPAGLTAGLYAARSRIDVVLLEKLAPGGQVLTTEWVENYPGFPDGIKGSDLIRRMNQQAEKFGLAIKRVEILSVDFSGKIKVLTTGQGVIKCKSAIIATGAQARKLGVPGEASFTGRGVSYCATCDGAFFEDMPITVVGGGDMAVEEGNYLTRFGSKVYLVHRRDELRATKVLQERVLANDKIEIIWDSVVRAIEGGELVDRIRLYNVKSGRESLLETAGVFVFVGTVPVTNFLNGALELDANGFIVVDRGMQTSVPGVFACGDVTDKEVRQISSAVGEGAVAAVSAEKSLLGHWH